MVRYKVQGNIFQGNIYKVYFIQSVLENRFLDWNMISLSPYQILHQKINNISCFTDIFLENKNKIVIK